MNNETQVTIQQLVQTAKQPLRLDCEILLAMVIKQPRSFIYAHPEHPLSDKEQTQFTQLWQRRMQGEPLAYLVGEKEFWGLTFSVNQHTLIPRPETELLVEYVLSNNTQKACKLLEIGTGCGAIACAIAFARPQWQIIATDIDAKALAMAQSNAARLAINNIGFLLGDKFLPVCGQQFDIIVSNPPYIAPADPHLKDLQYEPQIALIAKDNGLAINKELLSKAGEHLLPNGLCIVEHGHDQALALQQFAKFTGMQKLTTLNDLAGFPRVSVFAKQETVKFTVNYA